jgi:predicted NBD/HSP70 family sugar kinase
MFSFPTEFRTYGGIGAGIVIDRKIYKGSRMSVGEVVLDNSWKESKKYLIHAGDLSQYDYDSEAFHQIFREMVNNLANRIMTVTTLLDPDRIVLGGDVIDFSETVLNKLKEQIMDELDKSKGEHSQISEADFIKIDREGLKNIAIGGCLSFLNSFFSDYNKALIVLNHKDRGK